MKKSIVLISILFLSSCDIVKKSAKTKSDTNFNEQIETKTFRKGDTVTYEVPNVILKDTTIYRKNVQGTVLKTVYDNTGRISSVDCFSSFIEEIKKENREFQQSIKDKKKEKEEKANFDWLIYLVSGIVIVIIFLGSFFLYLMYKSINKNSEIINKILEK